MTKWRLTLLASLTLFLSCAVSPAQSHNGHSVSFLHITDPHIFLFGVNDPKAMPRQEELDAKALSDFFQYATALNSSQGPFPFIILTGDFGIDPCLLASTAPKNGDDCVQQANASPKRADEISKFASLFKLSPIRDIFLVAGNNDIAAENAGGAALTYFDRFIDDLQSELAKQGSHVVLRNLNSCYSDDGASSSCYYDVPNTTYRLIGFPSFSYKNGDDKAAQDANSTIQIRQFGVFRNLLDSSNQAGKKALIVTHVPNMDDPFFFAQDHFDAKTRNRNKLDPSGNTQPWTTWNVSKEITDGWNSAVLSPAVAAVFAGHLHDPHPEIYRPPYSWNSEGVEPAFHKLLLAPPLSVKNQDTSPVQARGFALVSLTPDHVRSQLYWYDWRTGGFFPDRPYDLNSEHHSSPSKVVAWFWNLTDTRPLDRAAIISIALLTAFLTIVAIWQIPPATNPIAQTAPAGATPATPPPDLSSPFTGRFGKTVIAGLGGLVAAEVVKAFGSEPLQADLRWFYIVSFILLFFLLLLILNAFRAAAEALRARAVITNYIPARLPKENFFLYLCRRCWNWFLAWNIPLLSGLDTFINLIQGKNQTLTDVFSKQIIDQQANIIRGADSIRHNLNSIIERALLEKDNDQDQSDSTNGLLRRVRVNISVLSNDQSELFYISRSAGSAQTTFPKRSIAWVAVFTGQIRWFKSTYRNKKIVLFDNDRQVVPGESIALLLDDCYQVRPGEDYQAFLIIPIPFPQRSFSSRYVKGGIHISFHTDLDFAKIWNVPDPSGDPPQYSDPECVLENCCRQLEVRGALLSAIAALSELLRGFNQTIYRNYNEPKQEIGN